MEFHNGRIGTMYIQHICTDAYPHILIYAVAYIHYILRMLCCQRWGGDNFTLMTEISAARSKLRLFRSLLFFSHALLGLWPDSISAGTPATNLELNAML